MTDELRIQIQQLTREVEQSRDMAMKMISASGELGNVLHFFSASWACTSVQELARALLEALGQYGLDGVVQLRIGGTPYTLNSEGRSSPMEQEMLTYLHDGKRLMDYGNHTLVSYERVSLLVRNMPLDDPERNGRMRDNLCYLAENADVRARALADTLRIQAQNDAMFRAARKLSEVIASVNTRYKRQQSEAMTIFMDLNEELTALFVHLGLTENQEVALAEAAARANHASQHIYEEGFEIDRALRGVITDLEGSWNTGRQGASSMAPGSP